MASTDPLIFQPSKIYAWIQVGEVRTDINDSATTLEILPSIIASETDTVGHRIVNGMDILIGTEILKVSDCANSLDNSITVTRAELANAKVHDTLAYRGGAAAAHSDGDAIYAWSELNDNDGNSLVQQLSIEDTMYQPSSAQFVFSNHNRNNIHTDKGILDGVLLENTPIKVIDGANFVVLFRGSINTLTKQYDNAAGATIQCTAFDELYQLGRSALTSPDADIRYDGATVDVSDKKITSIIKLLVQRFQFGGTDGTESTITMIEPIASNAEPRFQVSQQAKESAAVNGKISFASTNGRVLHALQRLALTDPSPNGSTFGYFFHIDANQYSFSTGLNTTPVLNYYPTSFMPTLDSNNSSPSTGILNFHNISSSAAVSETGTKRQIVSGASFDELGTENINIINVRYRDALTGLMRTLEMEAFYVGSGGAFSSLQFSTAYENASNPSLRLVATREDTAGINGSHDPDLTTVAARANFRSRVVDASNNLIGYVQYAGFTSSSAGLLILSGTSTGRANSEVAAGETIFLDNKDSGNTKVLSAETDPNQPDSFRPQATYGKKVSINMEFGADIHYDRIREAVAARFLAGNRPKVRARFQVTGTRPATTFQQQFVSADTIAETTVSSRTQVEITDASFASANSIVDSGNGINISQGYPAIGCRAGMPVMKLSGDGGTVAAHGYLSFVRKVQGGGVNLSFMLNTGSIADDDYVRFAVPLRAGHMVQQESQQHGVSASLGAAYALVTSIMYQETAGQAFTDIETVALKDTNQQVVAARRPDIANIDDSSDDDWGGSYAFSPYKPHFTGEIYAGSSNTGLSTGTITNSNTRVGYSGGTLYIGSETYLIVFDDSSDGTIGINGEMATTDDDADGLSDVSYIMYFEPEVSMSKFIVSTEQAFQQRNASEGRDTVAGTSLHSPIGINRAKIARITPNATGGDPSIELFCSLGAATVGENSSTANTISPPPVVVGGRGLTGNVNKNWLPTAANTYSLGDASFEWGDLYLDVGSGTGTALVVTSANQVVKTSSSAKYKENIKEVDIDSKKLFGLNPVSYNYKNSVDHTDFGLIAEEVVQILPDLVYTNEDGDPESVKYNGLTVLLLHEIKKLREEVDKLKNEGEE